MRIINFSNKQIKGFKKLPGDDLTKFGIGFKYGVIEEKGLFFGTNSVVADSDTFVFILNENKKIVPNEHFVFFNNRESPDMAVVNSLEIGGYDELNEYDELIEIDLSKMDSRASSICIAIGIYQQEGRQLNFREVKNTSLTIIDNVSKTELIKLELNDDSPIGTALEFIRIYKKNEEWTFEIITRGMDVKDGIQGFLDKYN